MSLADIQSMKALKLAKQNSNYIGNLFNSNTIANGFFLNSGTLTAGAGWATSDFMPVTPNTQYLCTNARFLSYFDSNKTFIGGTNYSYPTPRQNLLTRADGSAAYVRVTSTPTNMQSGNYYFTPI